jgi:hypothetical protein
VQEVTDIMQSENLSMPSGQMECDLMSILRLFLLKKALRLSAPKQTILFYF